MSPFCRSSTSVISTPEAKKTRFTAFIFSFLHAVFLNVLKFHDGVTRIAWPSAPASFLCTNTRTVSPLFRSSMGSPHSRRQGAPPLRLPKWPTTSPYTQQRPPRPQPRSYRENPVRTHVAQAADASPRGVQQRARPCHKLARTSRVVRAQAALKGAPGSHYTWLS